MPVPTWRLAVVVTAAAVVVALAPIPPLVALVVVDVAVLVVAVLDWATGIDPRRLEVERDAPGIVALQAQAAVHWTVTNRTGRVCSVRIADALPPSLCAADRRATVRVPAQGRARATTTIRPARRGRFEIAELVLRVEGRLGLVARQRARTLTDTVRVYPQFRSRREAELKIEQARVMQVGLRSARGRGGGTDFDQLREYQPDDQFRHIDWAATARRGKAVVRTFRAERNQTVLVLLDSGRVMAGLVEGGEGVGEIPRLDHGMDAVMGLVTVATALGDRAGFVAFADGVRTMVPPSGRPDQLGRVTQAMYELEPLLVESDYRGAFARTLARFRRRAMLVVLTELVPEAVEETLLPALPLIVRDHIVVIAGVRDPAVTRWARARPTDATTAYRKAAAVATLEARARLVTRLRGLGAAVVDEIPGELVSRLADEYLDVKAAGRL